MDLVWNIFLGLIGLSILVTIHEAGHFLAARWAGVDVEAFAIGWGKILWRWKPGKTEYRLCLLPLGGYCKMRGEQDFQDALEKNATVMTPTQGSLFAASPWKRVIISLAGPLANWVAAFVILAVLALTGVPETAPAPKILLASHFEPGKTFAADSAGLKDGDVVLSVDHRSVASFTDLQKMIVASQGKSLVWQIDRDGQTMTTEVTPQVDAKEGRPLVGVFPWVDPVIRSVKDDSIGSLAGLRPGDRIIQVDQTPIRTTEEFFQITNAVKKPQTLKVLRGTATVELLWVPDSGRQSGLAFLLPTFPARGVPPLTALREGWNQTGRIINDLVSGLGQLVTGKVSPSEALSGPLRITYYVGEVASQGFLSGWGEGWGAVAHFLAFISLALFFMNLLPIPALDGGTIVVTVIEGIRRRRPSVKTLLRYQQIGVFLILGLVLFSTFNDVGFLLGPK